MNSLFWGRGEAKVTRGWCEPPSSHTEPVTAAGCTAAAWSSAAQASVCCSHGAAGRSVCRRCRPDHTDKFSWGKKKITGWRWWSQRPTSLCIQMHFAVVMDWKALRERRHRRARQQLHVGNSFGENTQEKKNKSRTQRAGRPPRQVPALRTPPSHAPRAPHNANHKLYPAPARRPA